MSDHDTECLCCVVQTAIEEWCSENCERDASGNVLMDLSRVLPLAMQAVAAVIMAMPDRRHRRRAIKYAHECLDGGVKFYQTGTPQEVSTGYEH